MRSIKMRKCLFQEHHGSGERSCTSVVCRITSRIALRESCNYKLCKVIFHKINFGVQAVLTTGYWPTHSTSSTTLPDEMNKWMIDIFKIWHDQGHQ